MHIDIATLKFVLCLINILNLILLYVQYVTKKNRGVLYWIAGFGFIALSQILTINNTISTHTLNQLFSDISIFIGFCVVCIGISIFLDEKYNNKFDFILTFIFVVFIIFLFFSEFVVFEKILLALVKSIICYKIAGSLYFDKDVATKKSTNFISLLFTIYASVFLFQSISVMINGVNTNKDSPIFIVIYLFSIIIGTISTFGFINLINHRLTAERDKAEVSLKLTQYAMDNTSDAVFLIKKNASFLYLNKAAQSLLGYSYNELIKLSIPEIDPIYSAEVWPEHWNELKKKKSLIYTSTHIKKNGELITTEVNANYILFNDEEINCAFVRDITERKKTENHLNELIIETLDKNNRLQNFAHIVSHNIRSHAANFSGLLKTFKHAESEEEKDIYFRYLDASSIKLTETIDNLNEIISIQTNVDLLSDEVNLFSEMDKTIQSQKLDILSSNVTIVNNVKDDIFIKVVPAYLDSILLNLLTNSIKYKSLDKEPYIRIECNKTKNYTELIIEDNGIGIDLKKNGGKLFGMYKTFNGNADAKGIGLFITKNQVTAMKGKIEVKSEVGVGSTFKVSFKNA